MVDMGVERYLIPAALSLVMGQRLIRKLCTRCRAQDAEAEDLAEQVTKPAYTWIPPSSGVPWDATIAAVPAFAAAPAFTR